MLSAHKPTSGIPRLVVASQYNRHGQRGRQTAQGGLLTWRKVKRKSIQSSAKQTLEQGPRASVGSLFTGDTENLTRPCMTSSTSEADPALKVDGIRGRPEVPSTLQHSLILCQHRRCITKCN